MQINAKVKEILNNSEYKNYSDEVFLENALRDAYNENVWNEMVETLRYANILLTNDDADRIFKEYERKRMLIEANKAREAGLNNK